MHVIHVMAKIAVEYVYDIAPLQLFNLNVDPPEVNPK